MGLVTGSTYRFKVLARNLFGESVYSTEVSILAAQIPDQPDAPTTRVDGSSVFVKWEAPNDQGSAITGYKVYIETSTPGTYV